MDFRWPGSLQVLRVRTPQCARHRGTSRHRHCHIKYPLKAAGRIHFPGIFDIVINRSTCQVGREAFGPVGASPPGCFCSGETAEVPRERGFTCVEWLCWGGEGDGRHVVTLSRGLVKWQQRGAGRQVPPSDIVCGLAVGQNSSLPLPPLRPSPTPPSRPKTKLGPSQTLHALVLSLLYFPPLLYHLGHSVHFGFLRLFFLTSSVL